MTDVALNHLGGRRVHIAGSANASTPPERIQYAHEVIAEVARGILRAGGGLVLGVGKEPKASAAQEAPALVFDWTALEAAAASIRDNEVSFPDASGTPILIVASEKSEASIPPDRLSLWKELLTSKRVEVHRIRAGSTAGALIQQRQADLADALLVLGGGAGVEHSAELFIERRRSVVPLDLPLGASRGDGTGGSERLSKEARAHPEIYLRLDPGAASQAGAHLAALSTREGNTPYPAVAEGIVALLQSIDRPQAFYVRLLNREHDRFDAVEAYFREVIDSVVDEAGFRRVEVGTDRAEYGFLNVEIFRNLHFSSVAVVDVTGVRSNCFIELGYALGRGIRVIVTAEEGTLLPFDQQAIPCCFWKAGDTDEQRRADLRAFWRTYIDRGALVQ